MNFFIIHKYPAKNAELLPDYAIFKVNCREGTQILSDIGWKFGVSWTGQFKPYSPNHAKTREFWRNRQAFDNFVEHLEACLLEYAGRAKKCGKQSYTKWHEVYNSFLDEAYEDLLMRIPSDGTAYTQDLCLLLNEKHDKLTEEEINRLGSVGI